jgi:hypothetical protein
LVEERDAVAVFALDTILGSEASGCRCWHSCSWRRSASTTTSSWVLATLPLVMLIEVGFLVAFGVVLAALWSPRRTAGTVSAPRRPPRRRAA